MNFKNQIKIGKNKNEKNEKVKKKRPKKPSQKYTGGNLLEGAQNGAKREVNIIRISAFPVCFLWGRHYVPPAARQKPPAPIR